MKLSEDQNKFSMNLKAIEQDSCKGCIFDKLESGCSIAPCSSLERKDGKRVVWVEDK